MSDEPSAIRTEAKSPAKDTRVGVEVWAFRICAAAIVIGFYVKVGTLRDFFVDAGAAPVLFHELLPTLLLAASVVKVAWILPALGLALLAFPRRATSIAFALVLLGSSLVLTWNFNTYNDATWVTSVWSSVFLLWLANKGELRTKADAREVLVVAQAIVTLVFLGGFIGKLTGGYFDGTILKELYLERKDWLFWPVLRSSLSPQSQLSLMFFFSWMTLVLEGAMALSLLFSPRVFFIGGVVACLGIPLVSHWMLASVLAPLLGVVLAAAFVWRRLVSSEIE